MNNSIAVWSKNKPEQAHLHINYWVIDKKNNQSGTNDTKKRYKKAREHFLDIGLKLMGWTGGTVSCYFPLKLEEEHFSDLGCELVEPKLARALFNEDCDINKVEENHSLISIKQDILKVVFLDMEYDLEIVHEYGGTIIHLSIPAAEARGWYLRFRVKCQDQKGTATIRSTFSESYSPTGSFYQSVMNSVDAVDFRVADKKSLHQKFFNTFKNEFLTFEKLHFLVIHDQQEELMFSAKRPNNMRLLEGDSWDKYLQGLTINNRKYTTGHWTDRAVEAWDVFFKVRYCSSNAISICRYFLCILIFGVFINFCSTYLYGIINSEPTKIKISTDSPKVEKEVLTGKNLHTQYAK